MCIIAVCLKRKLTPEELKNSWTKNDDGAGVAWINDEKKVCFKKGIMKVEEMIAFYEKFEPRFPHVVHFRTSTAHGVCPELTHPFIVSEESEETTEYCGDSPVLFHNGVVSSWKELALTYFVSSMKRVPEGTWSDSRLAAVMAFRMGTNILNWMDGKYVLMNGENVKTFGDFMEDDGVLFSNSGYKTYEYCGTYNANWQNGGGASPQTSFRPKNDTDEYYAELYGLEGEWGYKSRDEKSDGVESEKSQKT